VRAWKGTDAWVHRVDSIFRKLDLNGDGHLSREEFNELWFGILGRR
jgi:Ca2+-binding EF-hand superfamily protein